MDAKSEFAHEGQKSGQRSLSAKMRKYVKQLYLFICKHISFQANFCMLILISLKNIEKMFLKLNVHMSTLKWGQRSSIAIIGAFS